LSGRRFGWLGGGILAALAIGRREGSFGLGTSLARTGGKAQPTFMTNLSTNCCAAKSRNCMSIDLQARRDAAAACHSALEQTVGEYGKCGRQH